MDRINQVAAGANDARRDRKAIGLKGPISGECSHCHMRSPEEFKCVLAHIAPCWPMPLDFPARTPKGLCRRAEVVRKFGA